MRGPFGGVWFWKILLFIGVFGFKSLEPQLPVKYPENMNAAD